jgi:hypothetical protein
VAISPFLLPAFPPQPGLVRKQAQAHQYIDLKGQITICLLSSAVCPLGLEFFFLWLDNRIRFDRQVAVEA